MLLRFWFLPTSELEIVAEAVGRTMLLPSSNPGLQDFGPGLKDFRPKYWKGLIIYYMHFVH